MAEVRLICTKKDGLRYRTRRLKAGDSFTAPERDARAYQRLRFARRDEGPGDAGAEAEAVASAPTAPEPTEAPSRPDPPPDPEGYATRALTAEDDEAEGAAGAERRMRRAALYRRRREGSR